MRDPKGDKKVPKDFHLAALLPSTPLHRKPLLATLPQLSLPMDTTCSLGLMRQIIQPQLVSCLPARLSYPHLTLALFNSNLEK